MITNKPNEMNEGYDDSVFVRIMVSVWSRRKQYGTIFLVVLALATLVAWILPKSYTTSATFQIKAKEKSSLTAGLPKGLKMLDPLSSENSGVSTVMAIFDSRQLAVDMIEKFHLMKKWHTPWLHLAIKKFTKCLNVEPYSEGIIHMDFTFDSQDSVKIIADSILAYVDARSRLLSTSKAKMDYDFLTTQVEDINADLNRLGDSAVSLLKQFNIADFQSQLQLGMEQLAKVDENLTELTTQQKLMETENSGPLIKMKQVKNVIGYLQSKQKQMLQGKPVVVGGSKFSFTVPYDTIPHLQKEFKFLETEVKKNEAYLTMVLPRVQDARISMVENTPIMTFIDPTFRPGYKSKPKRILVIALIVVPAMFLSFVSLVLWDLLRSPKYASDPGRRLLRYVSSSSG
jgi:capsule polysaccharide export protein KpsE/RkpR